MNKKVLTISIAAYNVENYLRKTIDSLLIGDETLRKIEILIEDDGSKDNTGIIGAEYEKRYPHSIKLVSKENGGYGSTINASIEIAHGKYFKQLDGDDWYKTENLVNFVEYLESCEADVVLSPFFEVREPDMIEEFIDNHSKIPKEKISLEICSFDEDVLMHEMTIRTDLLRTSKIKISEKCFYTDNEYTFLPLLQAITVSKFGSPVYCYRLGREGQSVSLAGVRKHYKDTLVVARKMFENYTKYGLSTVECKKSILETRILKISDIVYGTYAVLEDKRLAQCELKSFDKEIKNKYKEIYELTNKNKKIRFMRMMKFSMLAIKYVEKIRIKQF